MAGRHILITGGSRGIGAALVRAFCAQGDLVAFTYLRHGNQAETLAEETGAMPFLCDARSEEDVSRLFEALKKRFHTLDVLVSNAGTSHVGLLEDMSLAQFDDLMSVHVRGAFLITRAFLPMLRENGGSIVYISSMWGQVGGSCEAAYSAAKAALIGLCKAMAKEVAPTIRVNCVAPGVIDTDMMAAFSSEDKAALIDETPLQRLGTAEDVAQSVLFLCSPAASFITGQILSVSGGLII